MKIKNRNTYLYYFATVLITIKIILSTSQIITIPTYLDNIITVLVAGIFILKIFSQTYTKKQLYMIIIIGVLIMYVSIVCNEFVIALSYLAIVAMQDIEVRNVIRVMLPVKIVLIIIHIFLYCVIGNSEAIQYYTISGQIRHNLFLGHPNVTAGLLMWTALEYTYLKYEKINVSTYIVLMIFAFIIYYVTKSRTTAVACMLFVILLWMAKHSNSNRFVNISKNILLIISIIIIGMSMLYDKIPQVEKIDNLLSRRVSLGKIAIDKYGISVLPQKIDYTTKVQWKNQYTMYLVLDSIYMRLAISYGVIILLMLIIGFNKTGKYITNKEAIFIIMFAITGITENYILNAYICFPLLFLAKALYHNTNNKEEKEEIERFNINNSTNL